MSQLACASTSAAVTGPPFHDVSIAAIANAAAWYSTASHPRSDA
jgi:hypothetical protein